MGGNALSKPSVRVDWHGFIEIASRIEQDIPSIYQVRRVRSHSNKDDFGDGDFLIRKDALKHRYVSLDEFKHNLSRQFKIVEFARNGDILSCGLPIDEGVFQIDLIFMPDEHYWSAYNYFAYDPAGNLSGKLAHSIGVRYGHEGLFINIRESDIGGEQTENSHVMEKVILSKDINVINDFLGLWHEKWVKGFDDWGQIFDWIVESEFFDHRLFDLENLRHHDRVRDKKRKSYQAFLKYIKSIDPLESYKMSRAEQLDFAAGNFPHLRVKLEENKLKFRVKNEIRAKFNGDLVAEWLGLEKGPELGAVLAAYKSDAGFNSYDMFFKSPQEIKDDFMHWHKYNRIMG